MKMETKNKPRTLDIFFEIYNYKKRKKFDKENKGNPEAKIVFFGDSITDICDLSKYYPGINAVNRGISGNTTVDLINRIEVSVFEANPSKIILLIGINDMMNVKRTAKETSKYYEQILEKLRAKFPETPIICQSVYPGYDAVTTKNVKVVFPIGYLAEDIAELNGYIKDFCEKYNCVYVDIHSHLKMEDNTMNPIYSNDGCHPNDAGYQVVSKILKEYLSC